MEFLTEVGVFFAQMLIVVVAVLAIVLVVVAVNQRRRHHEDGYIDVHRLNDRYRGFRGAVRSLTEIPEETKAREKAEKKARKAQDKAAKARLKGKSDAEPKPRLFVLNFDGDIRAGAVDALREEISALLPEATERDAVLVRLESPGGLVHSYGLAASQLRRITTAGVPLTVAVDKVAASGGYMMACVANTILAAPFAVIGSIGVLAQLPNFHRLLKKNDIDVELFTAGEYKRTLTVFGENTDKGRAKFVDDLEETHGLFKAFVAENRPAVDIDTVATGEIWYGQRALDVNLVDVLSTSDEYIQSHLEDWDVLELRYQTPKNWQERLGVAAEGVFERLALKLWREGNHPRLY